MLVICVSGCTLSCPCCAPASTDASAKAQDRTSPVSIAKAQNRTSTAPTTVNDVLEAGIKAQGEKSETSMVAGDATTDTVEKENVPVTSDDTEPKNGMSEETVKEGAAVSANGDIDVDLTVLSSTLVYAEVYNMMVSPDDYEGKTVKMSGQFSYLCDESTGKEYFACIIQDATACCAQGIEFELAGDYVYPDDYPEIGEEVCVTGVFETYMEGNYIYCTLKNATFS